MNKMEQADKFAIGLRANKCTEIAISTSADSKIELPAHWIPIKPPKQEPFDSWSYGKKTKDVPNFSGLFGHKDPDCEVSS